MAQRRAPGPTTHARIPLFDLSTPSDATYTRPAAINDRGEVVGTLIVEDRTGGGGRAFPIQWSADGQTVFRLPLPPDGFGGASGINNLGVIVGTTSCPNGNQTASIWPSRDALPQTLIVPPGYTPSITFATDVNDAGPPARLSLSIGELSPARVPGRVNSHQEDLVVRLTRTRAERTAPRPDAVRFQLLLHELQRDVG